MAESMGTGKEEYDVFLVHSTADKDTAIQINKALQEKKLKTWAHYKEGNEFDLGKSVFDNIVHAVELSKIVLILVTQSALDSEWVTFEILMAFEKSNRKRAMCARLVFTGVTKEQKQKFRTGDLKLIPHVTVDFNKGSWKDELYNKITEKVSYENLLPAGNVALGLVFNYYVGYLRIILPRLSEASKQSEYYSEEKMYRKFVMLIPDSCKVPRIDGQHGDYVIKKMEKSLAIHESHGDKKRSYYPAVYSISKQGSEPYYFVGECPFILETMHKINEKGFAEIDLKFQVKRFSITMMELVNHRNNVTCHNSIHVIRYNDETTSPAEEIWNNLSNELKLQEQTSTLMVKSGKIAAPKSPDSKKYFATVSNINSSLDRGTANQIVQFLEEKKVKFTNGDKGPQLQRLGESDFNVFVLSEEAVTDPTLTTEFDAALQSSVCENEIKVFGVLAKGTNIDKLPQNMRFITLLKETEPDYLEKLWKAMQEKKQMIEALPPVGEVYEGLAYAYLLNYLGLALTGTTAEGKGFIDRFKDAMVKYDVSCPCVARVFVVVPRSCTFPAPGTQFDGEEHLGEIEPVVMGFRKYGLQMYRLTLSDGKKVCYAREYATPAITLHEMAHSIPFSGLKKEEMNNQAEKFADLVTKIIQDDQFKSKVENLEDKCSLVYFDDEPTGKDGVIQALESRVSECLKNKEYIEAE